MEGLQDTVFEAVIYERNECLSESGGGEGVGAEEVESLRPLVGLEVANLLVQVFGN